MNNGFLWGDGWDDPERLSPSEGCDLKHFVSASRTLRDALNTKTFKADNNADIRRLAESKDLLENPWQRYVDPAASRSNGKSSGTAIILWECPNHVLTCLKRRGKWTLLEGDQTEGMVDVLDNSVTTPPREQNHSDVTHSDEPQGDPEVFFADDEDEDSDVNRKNPDFYEIEEVSHNPDDDIEEEDEDLRIQKALTAQEVGIENHSIDGHLNDPKRVKELLEEIEELKEDFLSNELSFELERESLIEQLKIALEVKDSYEEQIGDLREKLHQSREIESELHYQISRLKNARKFNTDDVYDKSEENLSSIQEINLKLRSEIEILEGSLKDLEIDSKIKHREGLQREKDSLSRAKNAEREFKNLQSEMRREAREHQLVIDRLKTEIQHLKIDAARGSEASNSQATAVKPPKKKSRKRFFSFYRTPKPKSKKSKNRSAKKR